MASIRKTKKDVAYLTGEVISNCYIALYFQPESSKDQLIAIIDKAVQLHNDIIEKINNRPEKNNPSITKKHFKTLQIQLINGVDNLFEEISKICKK